VTTNLSWAASTDLDAGDTITYKVYFGTTSSPTALLTACNGISATSCDPAVDGNLITGTTYYWKVEARDNHGASTTSPTWQFTTEGTQPNVAPTDIDLDNNTVVEDDPADTSVGFLSTVDANAADTHTYSLVAGTGDTNNSLFKIGGADGDELLTVAPFSIPADTQYSIRVRSTDAGGLFFEKAFTILVSNVTGQATAQSTPTPTATATTEPAAVPTVEPTALPSASPTVEPTLTPTVEATLAPTEAPTATATAEPTATP
jgi:hypothetical protein